MVDISQFYKAVLEADCAPVVVCGLDHSILYMNQAAIKRYASYGGADLIGQSLLLCHGLQSCERIKEVLAWFAKSETHNIVYESFNEKENKDIYMVALRDDAGMLIGYYEKHECRNQEAAQPYEMN